MPRARNIKPGFFINDELAEVDPLGRLLFIGLWTIADREGRLKDRPSRIKVQTLPFDNCDVDALLNQLQDHGFIYRYETGGCRYIQILNFTKHQHPHVKEQASDIPAPDINNTNTGKAPDKSGINPSDSLLLITDVLKTENGYPVQAPNDVLLFYEKNFPGTVSPLIAEKLEAWLEEVTPALAAYAIEKAVLAEKRNFSYVDGILKNWRGKGICRRKDAEIEEAQYQQRKGKARDTPSEDKPRAHMTRKEQIERGLINDTS